MKHFFQTHEVEHLRSDEILINKEKHLWKGAFFVIYNEYS